jgi:hypothetical protein
MMGVGLLSLPFALKSSGWVGLGLLWLMGLVTNYTGMHEDIDAVVQAAGIPETVALTSTLCLDSTSVQTTDLQNDQSFWKVMQQ